MFSQASVYNGGGRGDSGLTGAVGGLTGGGVFHFSQRGLPFFQCAVGTHPTGMHFSFMKIC